MLLKQTTTLLPETSQQDTSKFTCLACQMAFPSSDIQRAHYRTDWHKYNLKRKMANLIPVTSYQFNEKVLAQQAKGQEERDRDGIIYHCDTCKKTYGSEPSYESHMRSKKHKEMESHGNSSTQPISTLVSGHTHGNSATHSRCLFCDESHFNSYSNLHHMSTHHSFFIPDAEYLTDVQGLINYCSNKIRTDFSCLYCNKVFKSSQATMAHMMDKGHCKMAYDDTEDVDTLLQLYDFEINEEGEQVIAQAETKGGELLLHNGIRLGHRHLVKYNRQEPHRSDNSRDLRNNTTSSAVVTQIALPESLLKNRKERRHPHLAITEGPLEEKQRMTDEGIHQAAKNQAYKSSVVVKKNQVNLLRFRTQVPI